MKTPVGDIRRGVQGREHSDTGLERRRDDVAEQLARFGDRGVVAGDQQHRHPEMARSGRADPGFGHDATVQSHLMDIFAAHDVLVIGQQLIAAVHTNLDQDAPWDLGARALGGLFATDSGGTSE